MKPTTVITRYRILAVAGAILGILLAVVLARLQFSGSGKAGADEPLAVETSLYSTTISAIRGEILDRNGLPLISNEQVYSIRFNRSIWDGVRQNEVILSLISLLKSKGVPHNDSLPISNAPYAYTISYGSTLSARKNFDSYLEKNGWSPEDKAAVIVEAMCEKYQIDEKYADTEKRQILGVRYEMEQGDFSSLSPYTFATDVGIELISVIKEEKNRFPGVEIVPESVRSTRPIMTRTFSAVSARSTGRNTRPWLPRDTA